MPLTAKHKRNLHFIFNKLIFTYEKLLLIFVEKTVTLKIEEIFILILLLIRYNKNDLNTIRKFYMSLFFKN